MHNSCSERSLLRVFVILWQVLWVHTSVNIIVNATATPASVSVMRYIRVHLRGMANAVTVMHSGTARSTLTASYWKVAGWTRLSAIINQHALLHVNRCQTHSSAAVKETCATWTSQSLNTQSYCRHWQHIHQEVIDSDVMDVDSKFGMMIVSLRFLIVVSLGLTYWLTLVEL